MTNYDIASRTVSPNAFFWMVTDALTNGKRLSCVRMADGEKAIWLQALKQKRSEPLKTPFADIPGWVETYGLDGITADEIKQRLHFAAVHSSHFAPSVSGLRQESYNLYDLFPKRDFYIDNFFVDQWSEEQKTELFKMASHVLFIHRNAHTADSMQLRVQANLGVKVHYIKLDNWRECPQVIDKALTYTAPLILFSGGPGGKYMAPEIMRRAQGPCVILDIGHGADKFTFSHLPINRPAAEAFHAEWTRKQNEQMPKV
jgi:hypothetical protein